MNKSENRLLIQLLERIRTVYGVTRFTDAHDLNSKNMSIYLGIKDMINNDRFNEIVNNELNKAYKYAFQLRYKTRKGGKKQ